MAAMVLNSERAAAMSVYVVQAFVKTRREFLANATLEARLQDIEKTLLSHDAALRDIIQKLRPLGAAGVRDAQASRGFPRRR